MREGLAACMALTLLWATGWRSVLRSSSYEGPVCPVRDSSRNKRPLVWKGACASPGAPARAPRL